MGIVKVSRSVEEILEKLGLSSVLLQARIASAWPVVVGPLIAGKTFPARLKGGVLTVHVLNHAWAQELTLSKPSLLAKIGKAAGEGTILDIRFRVGPLPGGDEVRPEREEAKTPLPPPAEEPAGLAGVADPETREVLLSLARRASARRARGPAAPPRRRGG